MGGANSAWAGDFIDHATKIEITNNSTTTDVTSSVTTVDGKKQFSFTPGAAGEFQMKFTLSDYNLTAGQAFTVVELSGNLNTSGNHKARTLTISGTNYENTSNTNWVPFDLTGGHKIAIMSPLSMNETWRNKYIAEVNGTMTATFANVILAASAASETTIYRVGMYTLGEILTLYPELKTNNFQINDQYRLLNDNSTAVTVGETTIVASKTNNGLDNGSIQSKNSGDGTAITTAAGVKLFCKAIDFAKLPDNYRYFHFRYLQPAEGEILREDVFAGINEQALLLLPSQLGANYVQRMPTWHKKINTFDNNTNMYVFTDGVAPSSFVMNAAKSSQSNPGNWSTYTRILKAGYNSCAMPFKKLSVAHEAAADLTFYKVNSLASGGTAVQFTKIDNPAADNTFTNGTTGNWTPVIIKAEHDGLYTFVGRDAVTDWSGIGSYESKTVGGSDNKVFWVGSFVNEVPTGTYASTVNYGITADGASFAKMGAETKTTYYRAFLADNRSAGARALTLSFDNGDGTTDIISVNDVHGMDIVSDGAYYNLAGQRISKPTKGLYIVNGKKVMIK